MKYIILLLAATQFAACASAPVAKNLNMVSFEEETQSTPARPIGNIEGKDCTWYVLGYGVGEAPSVRNAFASAVSQKEQSLIPGQEAKSKGEALRGVKNVSVQQSGFDAWLVRRYCMVVTGVGLQ